MIPPLISFGMAKKQARMTGNDLDSEIDIKMRLASYIVANHCKLTDIPTSWILPEPPYNVDSDDLILSIDTDTSPADSLYVQVPGPIQAATLLVFETLFNGETRDSIVLSDTVKDLLTPFRDPTMA